MEGITYVKTKKELASILYCSCNTISEYAKLNLIKMKNMGNNKGKRKYIDVIRTEQAIEEYMVQNGKMGYYIKNKRLNKERVKNKKKGDNPLPPSPKKTVEKKMVNEVKNNATDNMLTISEQIAYEKLRGERMRNDREEGKLIPIDEVSILVATIGSEFKEQVKQVPNRLCNELVGQNDVIDVKNILNREMEFILSSLSRRLEELQEVGQNE